MKKRILALAAVSALTFALCGCSGSSSGDKGTEKESGKQVASDLDYVKGNGKLVVGITNFEPMDYKDKDGKWIGFDAELAEKFAESIGVKAEFVEIDWGKKVLELDGKSIDCVWNGMTLNDEVKAAMSTSNAYCNNSQVVVLNKDVADKYSTVESLSELTFAVETGSTGKEQAEANKLKFTEVDKQADAIMEVAAGTSDGAIIDLLMASAMVGEGTSYENLTYTVKLNDEKYGVGFRKDSDITAKLNEFLKDAYKDGTITGLSEKYGVKALVVEQ